MSLESGSYVSNLVSSSPTGSDRKLQGDDHLRLIKSVLQNSFCGLTGAIIVGGTNGGVANAYTLTPTPPLPSYVDNMSIVLSPVTANTAASTINISGLGAVSLLSVSGDPLVANDLVTGQKYRATFDGTSFRLFSVTKNYVDQLAFSSALPAQSLGFLASTGSVAAFTRTFNGYAVDESKGANVASAATIDLQNTVVAGNLLHITGTTNISAMTLPAGAERTLVFDGILTLVNGANLILPGAANITTAVNDSLKVRGEGAGVARVVSYTRANGQAVVAPLVGDSEVVVHTGNGHGSTNNKIRRFTTTLTNTGTAITYADSATNGGAFTINETGLYAIHYSDFFGGSDFLGVSINSAQLTTGVSAINIANRAMITAIANSTGTKAVSRTMKLTAGDVVRAHTDGAMNNTDNQTFFAIRKVGLAP
jgi:hypothetical protein